MVGQRSDGSFVLVAVEGRKINKSRGVDNVRAADIMLQLGCENAVAFDGGGSTTFWYDGSVRNNPSDGKERKVGSYLSVVKK